MSSLLYSQAGAAEYNCSQMLLLCSPAVLYCTVLYCTVLYCTVLYCVVLCYNVLAAGRRRRPTLTAAPTPTACPRATLPPPTTAPWPSPFLSKQEEQEKEEDSRMPPRQSPLLCFPPPLQTLPPSPSDHLTCWYPQRPLARTY